MRCRAAVAGDPVFPSGRSGDGTCDQSCRAERTCSLAGQSRPGRIREDITRCGLRGRRTGRGCEAAINVTRGSAPRVLTPAQVDELLETFGQARPRLQPIRHTFITKLTYSEASALHGAEGSFCGAFRGAFAARREPLLLLPYARISWRRLSLARLSWRRPCVRPSSARLCVPLSWRRLCAHLSSVPPSSHPSSPRSCVRLSLRRLLVLPSSPRPVRPSSAQPYGRLLFVRFLPTGTHASGCARRVSSSSLVAVHAWELLLPVSWPNGHPDRCRYAVKIYSIAEKLRSGRSPHPFQNARPFLWAVASL